MRTDVGYITRPPIIRAFHGVTPTGNWFVLADIAVMQPDDECPGIVESRPFDTSLLLVLGQPDRDIITLQGLDA